MGQNDIFRKSSLLLCTLEGKLEVKKVYLTMMLIHHNEIRNWGKNPILC